MKLKHVFLVVFTLLLPLNLYAQDQQTLLNVSYDPTRELYDEFNPLFAAHWKSVSGKTVAINQSHGGSGKQARAVIDGLEADVVTLALAYDIDQISAVGKLIDPAWQKRNAHNSAPYTSTVVFVVRKGNPQGIKDWSDLTKEGVQVITPNPKTSGGARWNYLAAWGYALKINSGSEIAAKEFMKKLFSNVPVLDTGARGSTTTFVEREIGDVLLAWENEALLIAKKDKDATLEIVYPSISILAEPTVSVVDTVVKKKGTEAVAKAYLEYLYSAEGQTLAAKHFYRPIETKALEAARATFPNLALLSIDKDFGGWKAAHVKHFADGGTFDQIYEVK